MALALCLQLFKIVEADWVIPMCIIDFNAYSCLGLGKINKRQGVLVSGMIGPLLVVWRERNA